MKAALPYWLLTKRTPSSLVIIEEIVAAKAIDYPIQWAALRSVNLCSEGNTFAAFRYLYYAATQFTPWNPWKASHEPRGLHNYRTGLSSGYQVPVSHPYEFARLLDAFDKRSEREVLWCKRIETWLLWAYLRFCQVAEQKFGSAFRSIPWEIGCWPHWRPQRFSALPGILKLIWSDREFVDFFLPDLSDAENLLACNDLNSGVDPQKRYVLKRKRDTSRRFISLTNAANSIVSYANRQKTLH